jgi:hypothetical protein
MGSPQASPIFTYGSRQKISALCPWPALLQLTGARLLVVIALEFRYGPEYLNAVNATPQVTEQVTRLLPQLEPQALSTQKLMTSLQLVHRPSFL